MSPKRIQRRRVKGWRMPDGAVYVGRPTRWGNPARIERYGSQFWIPYYGDEEVYELDHTPNKFDTMREARAEAVTLFTDAMANFEADSGPWYGDFIRPLKGLDLACWCPLDQPCHADVLLKLANRGVS